jgi:predicted nucleic acid-binding protein
MLVDTSVWVDHLRSGNRELAEQLEAGFVWCHPFVIGEIACGRLRDRSEILSALASLPGVPTADHDEVMTFVERAGLAGSGIGWIDAHLLASARLAGIGLWTLDRKLGLVATEIEIQVG